MDNVLAPVDFMKMGYILVVPLVFFGIFTSIIDSKFIEFIFNLIKALAYGGLAIFMWIYVHKTSTHEVGMVTSFTFIFCCIECGDNLSKIIGSIITFVRQMIKIFKNPN